MSFISLATMQYAYFTAQLPRVDWSQQKILDFGGNVGNLLADPDCTIKHEHYWCLDVSKDAITMGQYKYPDAHFIFYDCYNFSFNPGGIPDLSIPAFDQQFDIIISYSIFTHTGKTEMVKRVKELLEMLRPGGHLLFTYIDPDFNPHHSDSSYQDLDNLEKRMRRLNDGCLDQSKLEKARNAEWSILLNKDDLYIESEEHKYYDLANRETYFSFFKTSLMRKLFPEAKLITPPLSAYPTHYVAELQHTCMLTKNE